VQPFSINANFVDGCQFAAGSIKGTIEKREHFEFYEYYTAFSFKANGFPEW
jgi:hypothetical protein